MKVEAVTISKGSAEITEINMDKLARNEVLVETKACGICQGDVCTFQGKSPGGRAMGHEGVGIVAEVGEEVKNVKLGDRVATLGYPAFAEFHKTDYRKLARIPDDVEDFALWISEPLACVVNGIRGSEIQIGDNVCIIGCGYMGLLLIQAIPKALINNFIALDVRKVRLNLAKKFGAEFLVNPKEVDAVKEVRNILGGEADIAIEASGVEGTINLATELVRSGGKLVIFGAHVLDETVPTMKWHVKGLRVLNTAPNFSADFTKDFHVAVKLLRKGIFDQKPLITHRFSYKEAEKAFKIASQKPADYVKGVLTF